MKYMLVSMFAPFSADALNTFNQGLGVLWKGMGLVIGVLYLFYLIVKIMIKLFPEKK